ncbi:hypothetical protein HMPREF3156_01010 [Neisseria sp. HMSC06F02]|nr:hypothetical protein HMPREF3156_01010 [Neisseria sp. HMSC06F02]
MLADILLIFLIFKNIKFILFCSRRALLFPLISNIIHFQPKNGINRYIKCCKRAKMAAFVSFFYFQTTFTHHTRIGEFL